MLHLPFLLYTWLVWQVIRILSHEHPTDRVTDDLLIGRRLTAREIPPGIDHYVDLTAEFEDPAIVRNSPAQEENELEILRIIR